MIEHSYELTFQEYKVATLWFSKEGVSNVANVLHTMDRLDNSFNSKALKNHKRKKLDTAVVSATRLGKAKMNRYYGLTDDSEVYRIATGISTVI